jgi:hypothetical protein
MSSFITTLVAILSTGSAAAQDAPPFDVAPYWIDVLGPEEVDLDDPVTVRLVLEGGMEVEDLDGLFEARHLEEESDPIRPPVTRDEDGFPTAVIEFTEVGTWEIVAFPDSIDREGMFGGDPGRILVEVGPPTPGWVLVLVIGGLVAMVATLGTVAVARSPRRPAAPWDRRGEAGNPLSREPR